MAYIFLRCKECKTEADVHCDGDNAMMCRECHSVDEFEDPMDELDQEIP